MWQSLVSNLVISSKFVRMYVGKNCLLSVYEPLSGQLPYTVLTYTSVVYLITVEGSLMS